MSHNPPQAPLPQSVDREALPAIMAQQAERARALRGSNATERRRKLRQLRDAILQHQAAIQAAGHSDSGRPASEVTLNEILPLLAEIKHTRRQLRGWMRARRARPSLLMFGSRSLIQAEPRGRSLILSPWCAPLRLSLMPLISAVAAGCTALIKPSPLCPASNAVLRQIVEQVFHADEVLVCEGDDDFGRWLLTLPFEHVHFCGRSEHGCEIQQASAPQLRSVALHLGGKCPVIVDESADLDRAAKSIIWGKFSHCGQNCLAPDHVWVHHTVSRRFIQACQRTLQSFYGSDPRSNPDYARIAHEQHFLALKRQLNSALDQGARLEAGGDTDAAARYIAPTLLSQVPEDHALMREEILGPILPITAYQQLDPLLEHCATQGAPLALYLYSKNPQLVERVNRRLPAGSCGINQCANQFLQLNAPFGGIGASGQGQTQGYWGFQAFSHQRTIMENRFSLSHWLAPPYNDFVKRMLVTLMASLR